MTWYLDLAFNLTLFAVNAWCWYVTGRSAGRRQGRKQERELIEAELQIVAKRVLDQEFFSRYRGEQRPN